MALWVMIAVLLCVTLAAILLPLLRGRDSLLSRGAYDANIYKDQLKAIDRELEEGLIEEDDAKAARIEISRKLLTSAETVEKNPTLKSKGRGLSRTAAIGLVIGIPALAIGLYTHFGSPGRQDMPLEARLKESPSKQSFSEVLARAERKLQENPDDGRGWEIMAPVYLRHQLYAKAITAYQRTIALLGPNGERLSGLADAMVFANDGVVSDETLPILKRAIAADQNQPKPLFWMALYHEQNNKLKDAETVYTQLLEKGSAHAPWRSVVSERLNGVRKKQGLPEITIAGVQPTKRPQIKLGDALKAEQDGKLKGPDADDIKRAQQMSPEDRQTMINQMVENLAERLKEEGGDVQSWMRLVNVYTKLGKKGEAQKALVAARKNLQKNQQDVARLDALAKKLGLGS